MERMIQRNQNTRRRGAVMVEFAIIIPVLLVIMLGIVEYGWALFKAHQLNNAARNGARIAAMPGATSSEVTSSISNLMTSAGISGYTVTITPANLSPNVGDPVNVRITVPYANVALVNFPGVPLPSNLRAEVGMAKEGA